MKIEKESVCDIDVLYVSFDKFQGWLSVVGKL